MPERIDAVLRRRRGTGDPLPAAVASDLGAGFGTDLTGVRVHTDPQAADLSRELSSVAFAYGSDLYFSSGAFRPQDPAGRRLLAHELAHVVQETRSPTPASPTTVVGRADDPAEHQADLLAEAALRCR